MPHTMDCIVYVYEYVCVELSGTFRPGVGEYFD